MKVQIPYLIAACLLLIAGQVRGGAEDLHIGGGVSYLKLSDIHPSIAPDSAPVFNLTIGSRDRLSGAGVDLALVWIIEKKSKGDR